MAPLCVPNTQRGRLISRKSARLPSRSNTKNAGRDHTSKIIRGRPQPRPVSTDIVSQRRFEVVATSTGTAAFTISTKALIDTIPGTSSLWDKVRFHEFDVYSNERLNDGTYGRVVATLNNPASGYFGDIPTGYNDPTGNYRRAHVGIVPARLFQMTWIDSTDTSPILTITAPGTTNSSCLVQFTVTIRTTAGAPTLTSGEVHNVIVHSDGTDVPVAEMELDFERNVFMIAADMVTQIAPVSIK